MKANVLSATTVVILTAALAACGGTSTATGSPATGSPATGSTAAGSPAATQVTDGCALVTEREASAALGADPGPGKPEVTAGQTYSCTYQGPGGLFLQVGLNPHVTRAQFDAGKKTVQDAYQQQPNGKFQDLSGIGDTGFVASSDHGGACEFLKGSVLGHVTIISPTVMASPADTLTSLCRTLAGRI